MGKLFTIVFVLFSIVSFAQTAKTGDPVKEHSWGEISNTIKSIQTDVNKLHQDKNAIKIARISKDKEALQAAKQNFKLDRSTFKKDIHYAKVMGVKRPMKFVTKQNHNKAVARQITYRRHNHNTTGK